MSTRTCTRTTTTTTSHDRAAEGWSLILQHSEMIERFSRALFGKLKAEDFEEARQDFILRVVEKGHAFDPSRSSASSWIYFQGMAVRKTMGRQFGKACRERSGMHLREDETSSEALERAAGDESVMLRGYHMWGGAEAFESIESQSDAVALAAEFYAVATLLERTAMISCLQDYTPEEMRAEKLRGRAHRDALLRGLGEREGAYLAAI